MNEEIYQKTLEKIEEIVANLEDGEADKILFRAGDEAYSAQQILEEVRAKTKFGMEYVQSWIELQLNP